MQKLIESAWEPVEVFLCYEKWLSQLKKKRFQPSISSSKVELNASASKGKHIVALRVKKRHFNQVN